MKSVAVTLDRERHLVANLNTLKAFYDKTGRQLWDCPMWKEGKDLIIANHVDDIWTMIWAFLQRENPPPTYEEVGDMLGNFDLMFVFGKCAEAYAITLPNMPESLKNALERPDLGTG